MRIILIALAFLISGCASTGGFNDTAYPYQYLQENTQTRAIKKIVIASANFTGVPTRSHLEKGASKVDQLVKARLRSNGYEILPGYLFENAWKEAKRSYGEFYDPTTGKLDQATWQAVVADTGRRLRESSDFDAVVFTDVIEHEVFFTGGMKHVARWYGISRKPSYLGSSSGIPAGFDWSQAAKGASLLINIYNRDLKLVLSNRGGLDTTQALNLKSADPFFTRKRKLLDNEGFLEEGVSLALHPFIVMKDYPTPKQ